MRQLQNNFTTPEQSKRLLELGVPADSADCCYHDYPRYNGEFNGRDKKPTILWEDESISKLKSYSVLPIFPCWSVGRLIEIMFICTTKCSELTLIANKYNMEYVLKILEGAIKYDLDFSKLED